jgi:Transglycosylase SLT domain
VTASGGNRAGLVEAVMPFLDEWQALLKDVQRLTPERVSMMLDRAEGLRHQADRAGQGAVVHHIEVCIACLREPALDRHGMREALRSLSEVTWQLQQEVMPLPRNPADPRSPADEGPRSIARPPLLSEESRPARAAGASRGGVQPPPPLSLPRAASPLELAASRAGGIAPPPNLAASHLGRVDPPVLAPQPRAPEPARPEPARPEPARRPFEPAAPPVAARAAGAGPAAAAPPILSLGGRAAAAPRAKDKPNLMVATMFGLRAFGRNKAAPQAARAPSGAPQQLLAQPRGVLGLGQRSGSRPSAEPGWIGPRAGGLPELATGPGNPPPDRAAADLDERLRLLRGGEEPRGERRPKPPTIPPGERRSRPSTHPPGADRARSGSERRLSSDRSEHALPFPWWIGGIAVAVVGLVVVGLLVIGRPSSAERPEPASQGSEGADTPLPTSHLLDEKERMRALISQVHNYGGGESPELTDLLNEEAALVNDVLQQSCDQPGDRCERHVPIVAGTVRAAATPQNRIHQLFEDRKITSSRSGGAPVAKWLVGLQMPAIGVQDDPAVRSKVEYYTKNQVGREDFQNMLFRCGAYRDLIEKALVKQGLPRALLALVMTESGCVAHIESPVGARGLWQFMPATGRAYHLHIKENVVDERISPPKSTEAAVKYLADLRRKMGSWEFALASYNMGPFGLSARIRRAGGDVTFWDLAANGFLPEETARYVPRIQAYALILENLGHFNFSTAQTRATEMTAELEAAPGTRLGLIARAASTSLDHLKLLNPDIVGMSVPELSGGRFMVQVPRDDAARARLVLAQLLQDGEQSDRCVPSGFDWGSERFTEDMCGGGDIRPKRRPR